MPTTEIATLTLLEGYEKINDPANEGTKVLAQSAQTLLNAPGCRRLYSGATVEDDKVIKLILDWENIAAQQAFIKSDVYGSFLSAVKGIVARRPAICHVDLDSKSEYDAALKAPVTEVVDFYFDGGVPSDYAKGIETARKSFPKAEGSMGLAWGATYENDIEYEGVKGQSVVMIIGWTSVDAHMAFRQTELFKELAPYIRSSSKKAKMYHLEAKEIHKQ